MVVVLLVFGIVVELSVGIVLVLVVVVGSAAAVGGGGGTASLYRGIDE